MLNDPVLSDPMPDDAVLDNPAWFALAGSQQPLGVSRPRAARYRAEVAPFAGLTDASDPLAWNDLADLVSATGPVAIGDTGPGVRRAGASRRASRPCRWSCPTRPPRGAKLRTDCGP